MIKEIYTRQEIDPDYEGPLLETSDKLNSVLTKVRTILGTKHGEVMGEYNFGVDLERMVFSTIASQADMESIINEQFNKYIGMDPEYNVIAKVKFGHHVDGYDYATIDISVNNVKIQTFMID